jgi:hypothetical protein
MNLNNLPPSDTNLLSAVPQQWLCSELDEIAIYESANELSFPVALEFEDVETDSTVTEKKIGSMTSRKS